MKYEIGEGSISRRLVNMSFVGEIGLEKFGRYVIWLAAMMAMLMYHSDKARSGDCRFLINIMPAGRASEAMLSS